MEQIMLEQDVIEELRQAIDDSMWQTEEIRKYNQEFQEQVNMQIYESNGITKDKMVGIKEYNNALYIGSAVVLFLLSIVLIVLTGMLHGFQSGVCLLMFAYTAMEGALLSQEKKQMPMLLMVYRILYIIAFPIMMAMFICYELQYAAYELFLPYVVMLGIVITILGTISYFVSDPYGKDKRKMREVKNQIRDIERMAEKEIRKEYKSREKEERNASKLSDRGEAGEANGLSGEDKDDSFLARMMKPAVPPMKPKTGSSTDTKASEAENEDKSADDKKKDSGK